MSICLSLLVYASQPANQTTDTQTDGQVSIVTIFTLNIFDIFFGASRLAADDEDEKRTDVGYCRFLCIGVMTDLIWLSFS